MSKPKSDNVPINQDDFMVDRLKGYDRELEEMLKKEEEAKKKEKAPKPMINKTNKMILCAVIFGFLVIACIAVAANPLALAALAIAATGVDRISLGKLTKDVYAVDFSMRILG